MSLPALYALRAGYLIIAVGLALIKWPLFLNHPEPWPLVDGVQTSMFVALSLLWFLGIRYPLQMLPVLVFELGWKIIWTVGVFVPLWRSDRLDSATVTLFYACLWVIIPTVVIPWRYVVRHYVTERGDRWRWTSSRP